MVVTPLPLSFLSLLTLTTGEKVSDSWREPGRGWQNTEEDWSTLAAVNLNQAVFLLHLLLTHK